MMHELDLIQHCSTPGLTLDPNNFVNVILNDEDLVYSREVDFKQPAEQLCDIKFDETKTNKKCWLTRMCVNFMPFNLNESKNDSKPDMHSSSNDTLQNFGEHFSKTDAPLPAVKRPIQPDDKTKQEILDINSWHIANRQRNFKTKEQTSISTLSTDSTNNRSDALNQTLNLIRSTSMTVSYLPDSSDTSLTRSDDIYLKKAISDINKSQRLSDVSTVNGSYSFKMDENEQVTTVFRSHS